MPRKEPLYPHVPKSREPVYPRASPHMRAAELGLKEEVWVYAKVGTTEVRGKRDPTGIQIEQVSPTYNLSDFDKAVKIIEEKLKPEGVASTEPIKPSPTGTCYVDAWRFLIKDGEGHLIHGSVQLSAEGTRVNHAWVELTTGYVWEPQTKQYFTAEGFRLLGPIEEHRYTPTEACVMVARTKKFGPWTNEEVLNYLKRKVPSTSNISQKKSPSTLTEPDLISLVKSWLDEWSDRYKLPPIGVKASGEPGYIAFDHNHNTILIDYPFIETVKAHEQALPALKFAVAHEFGHYVSLKRHGLAWYLESLKDCTISEQEADIAAKQLTGLTGEEAFSILEKYEGGKPCQA